MDKIFKKKILHRAKYRGIKELDIIFERFIKRFGNTLTKSELIELEYLLDMPDNELLDIIFQNNNIPENLNNKIIKKLMFICNAKQL
ncbi:uncharacterized protein METZ01_LOCUS294656 [marine metagenome]|uniref:FAD assembly factor SdhE n=1 Tax=marine metagenome TaxID=408172 RepID=A0A382M362_9ZZZZ